MAHAEYSIVVLFAAPQFGEMHRIFTGKAPQSKNCGALQDGALSGSAAPMEG